MKVIRVRAVAAKFDVSPATIWRYTKQLPGFPQPVKMGPQNTAWVEAEIDAYLQRCVDAARNVAA